MALTKVSFSMIQDAWIDVKNYGAIGDGVTNDTAGIVAAIASMTDGGVLYFPPGTYVINNNTIVPVSNTTWILPTGAKIKNVTTSVQYNMFPVSNVVNWTLCGGGTLEGYVSNDSTENGYILSISEGCENITIDEINFVNAMADCVYIGTSATAPINICINNIKVTGARRNGLAITAGENIRITNSIFQDTYNPDHLSIQSGLDIEPDAGQYINNVVIDSCTFDGNYGCGLSVYGAAGGAGSGSELISNVTITNNTFNDNCKFGLSVSSTLKASLETSVTVRCAIINNKFNTLNRRGGIFTDINRESVVMGNSITGENATATTPQSLAFLSGLTVNASNRMVVTGNNVRTSNYHGVYVYQSNDCVVNQNIADNNLVQGLLSQSNTNCEFVSNIFANTRTSGIYSLNDNYCDFLNNRIVDNNTSGLVTTNIQGASIVVTASGLNTPTNIKVMGNTIRTATTTPTYPLIIQGAAVTNCVACPNDFRGTFVNGVTDTGTGTILSQTEVVNLT